MKRNSCFIILVFICYLLQTAVFPHLLLADVAPNVLLILIVAIGYMRGPKEAMCYGMLCGIMYDCQYSGAIGMYAFIYMLIGYLVGLFNRVYDRDDFTIPIILVGVGDFVFGLVFYVLNFLLRNRTHFLFYLKRIIFPEMVYTVVVSVFLYKLIHFLIVNIENISRKES